jgi:hypothetical protein
MSDRHELPPKDQERLDREQLKLRQEYERPDVDWEQMLVYDCPDFGYWPRSYAGAIARGSRLDGLIYRAYRQQILSEIAQQFIDFALSDSKESSPYLEWVDQQNS